MSETWRRVFWWATAGAVAGLAILHLGDDAGDASMNAFGLISFASLGACLGCLRADEGGPFDNWF